MCCHLPRDYLVLTLSINEAQAIRCISNRYKAMRANEHDKLLMSISLDLAKRSKNALAKDIVEPYKS